MADTVIKVDKLVKKYGDFTAVKGVSFEVKKGEIFGLLGENGAGKTTTLEIIEGLRAPTSGEVAVLGYNALTEPREIKSRIGVQLQSSSYYSYLSLREILTLFGSFYHKHVAADQLLEMVNLKEKANSYVTALSGGQKQRFSIIMSLVNDPEIVFLDEPTTGLDPLARRTLWGIIRQIREQGKTVILTTHYLEEAEMLCERVAIMEKGEIIAMGKTSELVEKAQFPYTLAFETEQLGTANKEKLSSLGELANEKTANGYLIRLKSKNGLSEALDVIRKTHPTALSVQPASLEDIFIELTGASLKQDQENIDA